MIKKFFLLVCSIVTMTHMSWAQQFEYITKDRIAIIENGNQLSDPFSGGFNAVQVRELDLDLDGQMELVIFDRSNNQAYIGIKEGSEILIDHDRSGELPDLIQNWLVFADYDNDGRLDIFTDTSFGVKVIRNTENGWEELEGNLKAVSRGNLVNIVVSGSDYPAIGDFDQDGDIDLLVFDFAIGDKIIFYKNTSKETKNDDPLKFEKSNLFWGEVEECNCNDFKFNGDECDGNKLLKTEHAAAKALTIFGNNVLVGIEGCPETAYFPNSSDFINADFNSFSVDFFPKSDFGDYTVTTFADINNDGNEDFIVSNNTRTDGYFLDYSQSVNVFSGADKSLLTESFLQENAIDLGEQSYPALYDYDKDGDLDLFIGNKGSLVKNEYLATLRLYENTGTFRAPAFTLKDEDFLNLSEKEWIKINPTFTDVNNDGFTDLIISAGKKDQLLADVFLLMAESNDSFAAPVDWSFTFGRNDLPIIKDLNNDGLLDILLGKNFGKITVFRNSGTNLAPVFNELDDSFLNIEPDGFKLNPTLAFANLDNDPEEEIIKSDSRGILEIYQPTDPEEIPFTQNYLNKSNQETGKFRLGFNNPMVFGDLYGNGTVFGFIGDIRGGLKVIELKSTDQPVINNEITVYPNPVLQSSSVKVYSDKSQQVTFYDAAGRKIANNLSIEGGEELKIAISTFRKGVYFVRGEFNTFRLVIQ